jgi:hypothetical protein
MSYDKLDNGTMVIQRELLPVWTLIHTTIHPFTVQAKHKEIELELILQGLCPDDEDDSSRGGSSTERDRDREKKSDAGSGSIVSGASSVLSSPRQPIVQNSTVPAVTSSEGEVDLELGSNASSSLAPSQRSFQSKDREKDRERDRDRDRDRDRERKQPNYHELQRHEEQLDVITEHQLVLGDKPKLSQVIRNLVSNALKFTPVGGKVTIRVGWKPHGLSSSFAQLANDIIINREKQDNKDVIINLQEEYVSSGSLVLSVTDTGAGMSPENLKQLFQEGVQFNANKLQAGQGSGLGLWISQGIVGLHRGKLSATSQGEGFGSTFTLELPVVLSKQWQQKRDSESSGSIVRPNNMVSDMIIVGGSGTGEGKSSNHLIVSLFYSD